MRRFLLLLVALAMHPALAQEPQPAPPTASPAPPAPTPAAEAAAPSPPPEAPAGFLAGEGETPPEDETPPPEPAKPAPSKQKPATEAEPGPKTFNAVRLQGLNKVTARISTVDAPLGVVTRFENLEIIPKRCWQSPPEDQPENAALLEIRELKQNEGPQAIFKGWMYASSPGLSALEHPVYDITVIECENVDNTK